MAPKTLFVLSFLIPLVAATASLRGQQAVPTSPAGEPAPGVQTVSSPTAFKDTTKPPQRKEDWSALPLKSSGLDISQSVVVPLTKWDKGDYTEELVRVQWRVNDPFDLYVIRPKNVAKPPVVIYLYDYLSDTERFRDEGWCKRATRGGFAAVGFISALSMDRIRAPRPLNQWFVSQLQESLGTSVHDVQMILNYLDARGDIDMSRIGMFGQGSGASIAALAAAVDHRITTLELYNPWGDWPDWLQYSPVVPEKERANYLTPRFLNNVVKLDPALYLPHLKSQKVRIEYVLDDPATPKLARQAMLAAAPKNADRVSYQDKAEHAKAWRANGMSMWVKDQLKLDPLKTPTQPIGDPAAGVASSKR